MLLLRKSQELSLRSLAARVITSRNYSKDYDSSDDEKEPKKTKKTKPEIKTGAATEAPQEEESAVMRLNRLLASMQTDDNTLVKQANMARPGETNKKLKEAAKQAAANKDIFVAAKRVASMIGGEDNKKTESELLAKLLGHDQSDTDGKTKVKREMKRDENEMSLSELIVGMKIDRRQQPKEETRAEFVRRTLSKVQPQQQQYGKTAHAGEDDTQRKPAHTREAESYTGSVKLFSNEPLGIFKNTQNLRDSPDILSTWRHLEQRELQLQVTHPPANYYEKIALWTRQGKVWRFPIDNEQDMQEEADIDFSEHVFLEQHLEPWCPTKGPVRHFMELVCVGLSKNPYITAREKKEHILWYRDYFETKKDILNDLMSKEKMEKLSKGKKQVEA